MARMTARTAAIRPDAPALIDERGETTWAAFNARVNRLVGALRAAGIGAGDRIALFAANARETLEWMTAGSHMGVSYVPVNWHFSADELGYVVRDSGAKALIADARFAATATAADVGNVALKVALCGAIPGFTDYEAWLHDGTTPDEPAGECMGGPMFYTSGTTGRPKGVRASAAAAAAGPPPIERMDMMAGGLSMMLGIPGDGCTLLCGPVYHSAQWAFAFLPLMAGSTVVIQHKFDAAAVLRAIDAHRVTNVHMVPTQFHRLLRLDAAEREGFDGSSLKVVWHGAAPCPPEVKRQMIEWWGPHINEYYGSTEGSIVTAIGAADWLAHPTSVGRTMPTHEVLIVRDDGSRAGPGEEGTIYIRNRTGGDFEYHGDPEKTRAAFLEPGVFTTGDVGFVDADGWLHLSDRKIDMIISGGVNIYPAEIEAVLVSHPAVADAAVFGIPDEEFGEQVKAAIEVVPGLDATDHLAADLLALCRAQLAGYKAPKSIDFVDALPRTETGKLQKRLLRDPYWAGRSRRI